MFRRPSKTTLFTIAVLAIAVSVAGCGRRGALQPPPRADAPEGKERKASEPIEPARESIFLDVLI